MERKKEVLLKYLCSIPHNLRLLRAMVVGYYVDENGLATDSSGESIGEKFPGEYLTHEGHQSYKKRLVYYDSGIKGSKNQVDLVDYDGEFKMRLTLATPQEIRFFVTQIEIPKNQGITALYAMLCCEESSAPERYQASHNYCLFLNDFREEIVEALWENYLHSRCHPYFVEPSFISRVAMCTLKDFACLNIAKLRSIVHRCSEHDFLKRISGEEMRIIIEVLKVSYANPDDDIDKISEVFPIESVCEWRGLENQPIIPCRYVDKKVVPLVDEDAPEDKNYYIALHEQIINPAKKVVGEMIMDGVTQEQKYTRNIRNTFKIGT